MFQDIQSSPSWKALIFSALASFLGGGWVRHVFNSWVSRKKLPAEIDVQEAQADKTRAEARKLNAEADVEVSAIVERLHARIDQMMAKVDEVSATRDEYKLRYELQSIELSLRDKQVKRMKGILDAKGIKMSDFDEPKS